MTLSVSLFLPDAHATALLGRSLATALANVAQPPALLLKGDLGSGKTTLVRSLVESLPNAHLAEVSSPSFNIFNIYPTTPEVAHFDLYRLEGMPPDDTLFECLESPNTLTVIEWIQFLDKQFWPEEALYLDWTPCEAGRSLTIHAMGTHTTDILQFVANDSKQFRQR